MTKEITKTDDFEQTEYHLILAAEEHGKAMGFARQAVETAWTVGKHLNAAKMTCPYGKWMPALKAAGFSPSTAARLMRLNRKFETLCQLGEIGSVDDALRPIPFADPETELVAPPEPEPDPEPAPKPKAKAQAKTDPPDYEFPPTPEPAEQCSECGHIFGKHDAKVFDQDGNVRCFACGMQADSAEVPPVNPCDGTPWTTQSEACAAIVKAISLPPTKPRSPNSPAELAQRDLEMKEKLSTADKWRWQANPPPKSITADRTILEISCYNLANHHLGLQLTGWTKNELINRIIAMLKRVQGLEQRLAKAEAALAKAQGNA